MNVRQPSGLRAAFGRLLVQLGQLARQRFYLLLLAKHGLVQAIQQASAKLALTSRQAAASTKACNATPIRPPTSVPL